MIAFNIVFGFALSIVFVLMVLNGTKRIDANREIKAHNKKVWDAYGICNAAQNSIIEQLGNEKLRPRQRLRLQQALDEQFNIEAALDASMKK